MDRSDWQSVTTADQRLHLQLPADWRVEHSETGSEILIALPADDYQPVLTVSRETGATYATAREYLTANVVLLQSTFPGYADLGSGEQTVDGQEMAWHAYQFTQGEESLSLLCYYLVGPSGAYLVSMGVETADFPRYRPLLEQIGTTLRLG